MAQQYFFMSTYVGDLMVRKTLSTWPLGTPFFFFCCYCAAQASFETRNWDLQGAIAKQADKEKKKE